MTVSKDQVRKVAQMVYPQLWQSNPVEAVAKAVEFIYDAASPNLSNQAPETSENSTQINATVRNLRDAMKRQKMHVNVVSRILGVSSYTVRTWLEGKYKPNDENLRKIAAFIENNLNPVTADSSK